MKKLFVLFAAVALFVGIQACTPKEKTPEVEETNDNVVDEPVESTDTTNATTDSTVNK